jgi:hypothetical protein
MLKTPLADGDCPNKQNLALEGIHLTSKGVKARVEFTCSNICGASVESILERFKFIFNF